MPTASVISPMMPPRASTSRTRCPFGDAADGRIARHLRDQVDIERVQRGLQAHARGGHGGLASGMAGADDDYVELFGELHSIKGLCPRKISGWLSFILTT